MSPNSLQANINIKIITSTIRTRVNFISFKFNKSHTKSLPMNNIMIMYYIASLQNPLTTQNNTTHHSI